MKIVSRKSSLLVVLLVTAAAVSARAATCSVPTSGYPTIQAAVDDPTCSTIDVAPGVYAENVSIARSLVLNGAQAGQAVSGRTSGGPAESVIVGANPVGPTAAVAIDAASVTLDGFTLKNSVNTGAASGIQVNANGNDAAILNNFVDGIVTADAAAGAMGIAIEDGPDNVNISRNVISNLNSSGSAEAIVVATSTADLSDIVFIKDNTIAGITSTGQGAYALLVSQASLTSTSIGFLSNHVSDLTGAGWVHAVSFECNLQVPMVQNNDFTNLNSPAADVAAVWINNDSLADTASVTGNNFNLTEAVYGVKLPDSATFPSLLAAGCNWWGSPDGPGPVGPGHGARISPGVLYAPWRIAPTPDSCIGNNVPTTEAQCKNGGWTTSVHPDGTVFKSQGDCMQFVNNGH